MSKGPNKRTSPDTLSMAFTTTSNDSMEVSRENISSLGDYNIYCDLETTGFSYWNNDIVEISLIVSDKKFNIIDKYHGNAAPEINGWYRPETEDIHGYCLSELINFPDREETADEINNFLLKYRDEQYRSQRFVAHMKSKFDWKFLFTWMMKMNRHFDLQRVLRPEHIDSTIKRAVNRGYKDNDLKTWAERINFPLDHHRAESDNYACYYIDRYFDTGLKYGE